MGMQQIHVLWLTHKVPFQFTYTSIITMRMPIAPKGVGLFIQLRGNSEKMAAKNETVEESVARLGVSFG